MYVVQFPSIRVIEHRDPRAFDARVGRWLTYREAENCYILGVLASLTVPNSTVLPRSRMFSIEDGDNVVAVAILLNGVDFQLTWVSEEVLPPIVTALAGLNIRLKTIFAPGHVSWHFAKLWTERTKEVYEFGRAERVYQLSRIPYDIPSEGRLERATVADVPFLTEWVRHFATETEYELDNHNHENLRDVLINSNHLFLWKTPHPVSMAAWVHPTPHGGCINFVYTPPEFRGKGYAKAAVAAVGKTMLSSGLRYCFIFTDINDRRTHNLYQEVGARTIVELLRCTVHPAPIRNTNPLPSSELSKG